MAHLRRQQLQLLCRQARRSPFAIAFGAVVVACVAWPHVAPAWPILTWVGALLVIPFSRRFYADGLLRAPPADARRGLQAHLVFMFISGIATGMAAPLFFPQLPAERQSLLTMILVCWTAGAVSTTAAYGRAFYVYVWPVLVQLSLMWALAGTPENITIAALILAFGVIQTFFVVDNQRVVRDSFEIRYENERLIEELEHQRQEAALARDSAEAANQAKSRFLAAASHDLRQPLHALSLYSAALQLRSRDGEDSSISGNINLAVVSLSGLVNSLLDISRLDAGAIRPQLQRVGLQSIFQRVEAEYRPLALGKGLDFRVVAQPVDLYTDAFLLERLVRNLVDNALKYTLQGTVILRSQPEGRRVSIAVEDTGVGIPLHERERIFEEFYQIGNSERDRVHGLGLGLAIVRRLTRLLDLQLQLRSEVGRGSVFSFTMPCLPASVVHDEAAEPQIGDSSMLADRNVLVIDDEPSIRIGMRTLLESWGCRVALARGREEAEQLLDRHPMRIDVIIADLRLRAHESGIEVVRTLQQRVGAVPAFLVTGDTAPDRIREAQVSGLPLLHKPVPPDRLRETLIRILET